MALSNYTSFDEIRAALGVTDNELEDLTLELALYETGLIADLDDISPDLNAQFIALLSEAAPTAQQERFVSTTRVFATYAVAKTLTNTLPMFGPKSVEDGKARMERFTDPYRDVIKSVNSQFEKWRDRLAKTFEALGQVSEARVARPYVLAVTPASDPILGT